MPIDSRSRNGTSGQNATAVAAPLSMTFLARYAAASGSRTLLERIPTSSSGLDDNGRHVAREPRGAGERGPAVRHGQVAARRGARAIQAPARRGFVGVLGVATRDWGGFHRFTPAPAVCNMVCILSLTRSLTSRANHSPDSPGCWVTFPIETLRLMFGAGGCEDICGAIRTSGTSTIGVTVGDW